MNERPHAEFPKRGRHPHKLFWRGVLIVASDILPFIFLLYLWIKWRMLKKLDFLSRFELGSFSKFRGSSEVIFLGLWVKVCRDHCASRDRCLVFFIL